MGAWGYGLLQNDDAQDGLLDFTDGVEEDIVRLRRRRPAAALAGRLAGAFGLLLQLRIWHCFAPGVFHEPLMAVLERHEPAFHVLPKTAIDLFRALREGKGEELVAVDGDLPADLAEAFFDSKPGFAMERPTGYRHPGLFEHPASAAYAQEIAERCVKRAARGFRQRDLVSDMGREAGEEVAALCILLQVEPCQVDAELFRDWWDRYRAATAGFEDDPDETERKYHVNYRRCLRLALDHGLRRFSGKKKVKPLEK